MGKHFPFSLALMSMFAQKRCSAASVAATLARVSVPAKKNQPHTPSSRVQFSTTSSNSQLIFIRLAGKGSRSLAANLTPGASLVGFNRICWQQRKHRLPPVLSFKHHTLTCACMRANASTLLAQWYDCAELNAP